MKFSHADFQRLEELHRFSPQTVEIAKRRILDRTDALELANTYGLTIGRIYHIENRMRAAIQKMRVPEGWTEVTLIAPIPLVREFKKQIHLAQQLAQSSPAPARRRTKKPT